MNEPINQTVAPPTAAQAIAALLEKLTGIPFLQLLNLATLIFIAFGVRDDYQAPNKSKTPAIPPSPVYIEEVPEYPSDNGRYTYPGPEKG